MSTYMHQCRTISIPSSLRRNICCMSAKSNMISKTPCALIPNTSGWCGAYMVFSPSLHALLYQLCILCMKLGQSHSIQFGNKSFPYTNSRGASSKFGRSSTASTYLCNVSVRGVEKPDLLLALEVAGFSFDLAFLAFPSDFLFVACNLSTISDPSLLFQ